VLLGASIAFALISLLTPFCTNLPALLAMQFLGGAASGFFIPLTLSFVLLNTPPKYWAFGIALYALNLELSLNISASLEGFYVEHLSWHWIFWQNVPLALIMSLSLRVGMQRTPWPAVRPPIDWFGLLAGGGGLALIYAALDQGNRLDWLNSGLITSLLCAGALLFVAFIVHETRNPHPPINLKVVLAAPLPTLLLLVAFLRFSILATAFLIPQFLGVVRQFRALEVGDTLIWIAAPQLILCPLAGLMLRRSDPRLVASIGLLFISVGCLMVAYNLTPVWGSEQFLPSQLLQAMAQSFALSGVVFFGILHLRPQDALTFGASLQMARLMGGEIGTAFITTLTRVRGQVASNLIGQHVQVGDGRVIQRIQAYGSVTGRFFDPPLASARGAAVLGNVVRTAATTQAVLDAFVVVGVLAVIAVLILTLHPSPPPGPASARPLFPARAPPAS
jgi:DHA2 family multidrug resistance protein